MRDPFEQLRRIQEAIAKITSYVQKGRHKFEREEAVRLSIIYYLQTISEAVNTLPADFKAHYSEIPWQQFGGFQNFLTHYYNDIDQDALWNIVEHDLPLLNTQLDAQFTLDDRITEQNKSIDLTINNDHSQTATDLRKLLQTKRKEILLAARKHGASNVRVFGSVVRGKADEKITHLTKKGKRKFDREEEIRLSIIYYIQIIGEAASTIPLDFRNSHNDIPWRQKIAMRNKLIHHYDGIDLKVVWETATISIPHLEPLILALLKPAE